MCSSPVSVMPACGGTLAGGLALNRCVGLQPEKSRRGDVSENSVNAIEPMKSAGAGFPVGKVGLSNSNKVGKMSR